MATTKSTFIYYDNCDHPEYFIDRIAKLEILKDFIANNWSYCGDKELTVDDGINLFLLSFTMTPFFGIRSIIQRIAKTIIKKDLKLLGDISFNAKWSLLYLLQGSTYVYNRFFTPLIEQYSLRDIMGFDYRKEFKKLMANKYYKDKAVIYLYPATLIQEKEKNILFTIAIRGDDLTSYPFISPETGRILYGKMAVWVTWDQLKQLIEKLP